MVEDGAAERTRDIQTVVHRRIGAEDANPARKAEGGRRAVPGKGNFVGKKVKTAFIELTDPYKMRTKLEN
jgi:hypothetical protein